MSLILSFSIVIFVWRLADSSNHDGIPLKKMKFYLQFLSDFPSDCFFDLFQAIRKCTFR